MNSLGRLLVLCGLAACTPIGDVQPGAPDAGSDALKTGASRAGFSGDASDTGGATSRQTQSAGVDPAEACDESGLRMCARGEPRAPLVCDQARWMRLPSCAEDQRCESAPGPGQGRCVPIPSECIGRRSGEPFCSDSAVHVCNSFVASTIRTCSAQERCVAVDPQPECACASGTVMTGNGCQAASDCTANGGCDMLTACTVIGGKPVCGACPAGYVGDGITGCAPLLGSLVPAKGVLVPAFEPMVTSYRAPIPLLQERLSLGLTAPPDTQIEINGEKLASGANWSSPILPLGELKIVVVLTSKFGVTSRYELTVERAAEQEAYVKAQMPGAEDGFGFGLSISGDTLVVGALYEDSASTSGDQSNNAASNSGAAYVFVREGKRWTQQAYLKSDKPSTDDFFGLNVAVSGDTLAVSSTRASPYGDISSRRRGLVYVYTRTAGTWTRQATLSAPDGDGPDLFGYGLALQHDRLVVGAPFDSQSAAHGGAVYVFTRSGGSWSAPTKLVAMTPQAEDYLGCSVALDADTLLAGAHHENQAVVGQSGAGSARVFVRRDNTWVEQQRLQAPSPGDGDMFGFSVALLGDTAIVGAPHGDLFAMVPSGRAYVFERSGDKWMTTTTLEAPVPRDADYFGGAVALSQSAAVVGANGDASGASGTKADAARDDAPQSGAFYVYTRNEETWIRSAFVKAAVVDRDDRFARRVALDGDTVVVSTIDEGSNASGIDGDATNDGAKWSGAAYVFR